MSLTISVVRAWDLGTVGAQLDNLRRDDDAFDTSAATVRRCAEENLDGLDGDTVPASRARCFAISQDLGILSGKSERLSAILTAFLEEALVYLPQLIREVDSVPAEFSVEDDGTVRSPALIGDPSDPALATAHKRNSETATNHQEEIQRLLRELERCDLEAANGLNLMSMTESYVHYPFEPTAAKSDPRTIAASATIDASTGLASHTAKSLDAASAATRALPIVGTALNLAIGSATSPDEEPLAETLAAEGAALASVALTSAAAGSVVPGIGTAVGLVTGLVLGPEVTEAVRNEFTKQKSDGKEGFSWW